ncbi:hypothetical protein ABPG74_004846 [Tetrahymena malaccensis]
MQNIIQVFNQLLILSDFVCLLKDKKKYYLCPVDNIFLRNSDDWKTQQVEQNAEYTLKIEEKIEISSLYQEFLKYITQLTNNLSIIEHEQQQIESVLNNNENINIIDQIQFKKKQLKQSFEITKSLKKLKQNYQTLQLLLMMNEGDFQIQFKNPLKLDFKKLKKLTFKKVCLNLNYTIYPYFGILFNEYSISQTQYLHYYKYQMSRNLNSEHLNIRLNLKYQKFYQENYQRDQEEWSFPEIKSNYNFLYLDCSGFFSNHSENNQEFEVRVNQLKDQKYRGKLIVVNLSQNFYIKPVFEQKSLEIPSIIDGAQCFVYGKKIIKQKKQKELFLEDQTIISLIVLTKNQIQSLFTLNIAMIFTDLYVK